MNVAISNVNNITIESNGTLLIGNKQNTELSHITQSYSNNMFKGQMSDFK